MAYSSLTSKSIISPNYVKRTAKIDCISIHCPCGVVSLDSMGKIYHDTKNKSSCHYGIDTDGNIAVFVDEKNAAMSLSNSGADNRSITIQVSATTNKEPYPISNASIQSLQDLLVDICIRNNIKKLAWMNDSDYARAASLGGPVDKQNMFICSWFTKKSDPGKWLHDYHTELVQVVNAQLNISRENMRRIIFIGDTRTKAIHETIGTDLNFWYTKNDPACTWVGNKIFPYENEIGNKSAVCIMGGWNDCNYTKPQDYAERLNEFARRCFARGCAVYYVSATPISRTGYGNLSNQEIVLFNASMKDSLMDGIGYIDAYSAVQDTFIVTSGKDYDANTNKIIYSTIIAQASRLSSGIRLNLNLNLDPTNFHPYMVMFDRNADVDYKALSDLRVVGAIIEAGYRFDVNGKRTAKFDNPNIKTQIEQLDKYKIPYGMYTICRAKSPEDAKTEMQYFQYQLYRNNVTMGVWLNIINLGGLKVTKDIMLDTYHECLTNLGFKGKMGIICTRQMLETISWDKWQDEFYLYLVDHLTDLTTLDSLLDPTLFDVG